MRSWIAAAFLLAAMLANAHADYYRFMYIPGAARPDKDKKEGEIRPGFPQPGVPGQPGFPGQPGVQPGGPFPGPFPGRPMGKPGETVKEPDEDDEIDLTQARIVVVEAKKTLLPSPKSWGKRMIEHRWGKTSLHKQDDIAFKRIIENRKIIPTVAERYEFRKKELAKEKKAPDAEKILETAEFCLTHGLYDKFVKEMDDLVDNHGKHPVAVAYKKTRDALKKVPKGQDDAQSWKDRLTGNFKLTTTTHYAALYMARETEPLEVRQRLKRLEENYNAFFYWFTLKGITPHLPDRRQVVIFAEKVEDFFALYQAFEGPPLTGDGFLARRENIAIFSMTPLDEAYDMLAKSSNEMWTLEKWSKDDLLLGRFKGGVKPDDSAYAQEVALLLKAMQDECELQVVTYVGSQQLMASTGLLPGTVAAPLWLQYGIGSFFETPKGAYWAGTGAPHWKYFVNFRNWRDDRNAAKAVITEKPEEIFLKVISDQYYAEARRINTPQAWEKANTMGWALTYYLAQNQNTRDNFLKFLQELANLPRDMQIDPNTYMLCFARSFNLVKEGEAKLDETAVKKMVKDWYYEFMSQVQLEMPDAFKLAKKIEEQRVVKAAELEAEKKKLNAPGQFPPGGVQPGGPGPGMGTVGPRGPGPRGPGGIIRQPRSGGP
jgi:hypothetical protein